MKILALILARGGSKRLPGKNIRPLGGKPLIVWSIDVVRGIPEICDILVSTDSPEIASICAKEGACVPWLRPEALASDTATSVDAALHALDWYETENGSVDGLLLLQPTSPFRNRKTVIEGINLYSRNGQRPVLAVSPVHANPMWAMKIEESVLTPFVDDTLLSARSQDLPKAYMPTGGLYLISPRMLRCSKKFSGEGAVPLIIESPKEAVDIDTEWDWHIAQSSILNK